MKAKKGIVISSKGEKTIVVEVRRMKKHLRYHKRFLVSKKYKVHDEENKFRVGDEVSFVDSKPFSKDKKWVVKK
jgi:small subunit ribosomal protein S17